MTAPTKEGDTPLIEAPAVTPLAGDAAPGGEAPAREGEAPAQPRSRTWLYRGLLIAIVIFAAVLRLYDLRDIPAGLFCDEAALGYNAWAISHYGVDENNAKFPLFVWSFAGYKNPVYIYAAALPIAILGLDEFSLRLTSVLFGLGTIIAIFYLGRALLSPWVGLWAAFMLAISPWHLHFSRIAFELISFPFLFVIGLTLLVRFTQGRRTLWAAFFFLGSCLYAYAIAKLFVPLFLIGFGILYLPTVWRRWREWLVAVPVLLLTVAPVLWFDYTHQRGSMYFESNSIFRRGAAPLDMARNFVEGYQSFFSPRFLFEYGDIITRHAVRGHGELYPFWMPLLILGAFVLAIWRDRATKLILWWAVLYPVGASLMTEIPSASRGFIGAPMFAFVAGVGVAAALRVLGWIGYWRPVGMTLQLAGVAALGYFGFPEVEKYMHMYFEDYVKYSAPTYGGFQYGYRDVVNYMEPERDKYDLLMMTATEVNQPYIFGLFYGKRDPREFARTGDPGYLILDPAEYRRYPMDKPILYALREEDMTYFNDPDIKRKIVAPGGQVEFIIAEVRQRKQFILNWLTLGLFDNHGGAGINKDFIDVHDIGKRRYTGKYGEIYWRPMSPQFIRIDFNVFYAAQDRDHPGNPEEVCAYALTQVESPTARKAILEIGGSDDPGMVWLNGELLTPAAQRFGQPLKKRPIDLVAGANVLIIKTCENVGSWYFTARLTDTEGRDLPDVTYRAEVPVGEAPKAAPRPAAAQIQVAEGFAEVKAFHHTAPVYPDYRGGTESWWTYQRDGEAEVAWVTAPIPRKEATAVAFTASMGEEAGEAELWINGEYALTFDLGISFSSRNWERGPYRLGFTSKQIVSGNSGVFVLTVPADAVTPGKPLDLRVVPSKGEGNSWFMIKKYPDTAAFEHITPELVAAMGESGWQEE